MKYIPNIAGILLGLLFLMASIVVLFHLAYHIFVAGGADLTNPMLIAIVILALYLLWVERGAFAVLVNRLSKTRPEV